MVVPSVLARFDVDAHEIGGVQKGYRNESYPITLRSGQKLNLIFYKREPDVLQRIVRADAAAGRLADAGMPVRVRHDPRLLRLASGERQSYAGIYTYLPGATIPWEAYAKAHIKLLGWAMSDMHACWKGDASVPGAIPVAAELEELLKRMERYFMNDGVKEALRRKLGLIVDPAALPRFVQLVQHVDTHAAAKQPLHMDMVRGNVLFAPARADDRWQIGSTAISGVIDFEKTALGSPLFDIARTLAFLFVDCEARTPGDVMKYFLRSGYNRRGNAHYDPAERIGGRSQAQLLSGLIGLFLLHDFYKFLRHTPYESLRRNHHFVRTRDMLVANGMIRYNKD